MELHEEIRRARVEMQLTQDQLATLSGVQRRQISILENGGNVTLSTLRKVIRWLPNLEEFDFEQVRMKPRYIDIPPVEWGKFSFLMVNFMKSLDELTKAINRVLTTGNAEVDADPEGVTEKTQRMMAALVEKMDTALRAGWKEKTEKESPKRRAQPKKKKRKSRAT